VKNVADMPKPRKVRVEVENEPPKASKKKNVQTPSKKQKFEPEWTLGNGRAVINIILSVQKSDVNNAKSIAELTRLYKVVSFDSLDVVVVSKESAFADGSQKLHDGIDENGGNVLDQTGK
jgi:hypothetical protein